MRVALIIVMFLYSFSIIAQDDCKVVVDKKVSTKLLSRLKKLLPEATFERSEVTTDFKSIEGISQYEAYLNENKIVYSNETFFLFIINNNFQVFKITDWNKSFSCNKFKKKAENVKKIRSAVARIAKYIHGESTKNLGSSLLVLEHNYLVRKHQSSPFNLDLVIKDYQELIARTKEIADRISEPRSIFAEWKNIKEVLYSAKSFNLDYCRDDVLMSSAFTKSCTNCVGETMLMLSLFIDSHFKVPNGWTLATQLFKDHVAPVLYNKEKGLVFDLTYGSFRKEAGAIVRWSQSLIGTLTHSLQGHVAEQEAKFPKVKYEYKQRFCISSSDGGHAKRDQLIDFSPFYSCGEFQNETPPERSDNTNRIDNTNYSDVSNFEGESFWEGLKKNFSKKAIPPPPSIRLQQLFKDFLNADEKALVAEFSNANKFRKKEIEEYFSSINALAAMGIRKEIFDDEKDKREFDFISRQGAARSIFAIVKDARGRVGILNKGEFTEGLFWIITDQSQEKFEKLLKMNQVGRLRYLQNSLETAITENRDIMNFYFDPDNIKKSLDNLVRYQKRFTTYLHTIDCFVSMIDAVRGVYFDNSLKYLRVGGILSSQLKTYLKFLNSLKVNSEEFIYSLDQVLAKKPSPYALSKIVKLEGSFKYLFKKYDFIAFSKILHNYILFNKNYFFTVEPTEEELEQYRNTQRPYDPISLKIIVEQKMLGDKSHQVQIYLPKLNLKECQNNERGLIFRDGFYIECNGSNRDANNGNAPKSQDGKLGKIINEERVIQNRIQDGSKAGIDLRGSRLNTEVYVVNRELVASEDVTEASNLEDLGNQRLIFDPRKEIHLSVETWMLFIRLLDNYDMFNHKFLLGLHHAQREKLKKVFIIPGAGNIKELIIDESLKFSYRELLKVLEGEKDRSNEEQINALFKHFNSEDSQQYTTALEQSAYYPSMVSEAKYNLKDGWKLQEDQTCGIDTHYMDYYRYCGESEEVVNSIINNYIKKILHASESNPEEKAYKWIRDLGDNLTIYDLIESSVYYARPREANYIEKYIENVIKN